MLRLKLIHVSKKGPWSTGSSFVQIVACSLFGTLPVYDFSSIRPPTLIINVTEWTVSNYLTKSIQCKPDISRLVGSMERYRDISGSAIYRATAMSQNPGQVFQRVVSGDGAFVCLTANSARRQRIPWHLSKFDVALQNREVEFQTKAVCA